MGTAAVAKLRPPARGRPAWLGGEVARIRGEIGEESDGCDDKVCCGEDGPVDDNVLPG